jgi:hypothetical protein
MAFFTVKGDAANIIKRLGVIAVPHMRHSRESGTKSAEADLNSLWLARRAKYMDVFRNPVALSAYTIQ